MRRFDAFRSKYETTIRQIVGFFVVSEFVTRISMYVERYGFIVFDFVR